MHHTPILVQTVANNRPKCKLFTDNPPMHPVRHYLLWTITEIQINVQIKKHIFLICKETIRLFYINAFRRCFHQNSLPLHARFSIQVLLSLGIKHITLALPGLTSLFELQDGFRESDQLSQMIRLKKSMYHSYVPYLQSRYSTIRHWSWQPGVSSIKLCVDFNLKVYVRTKAWFC